MLNLENIRHKQSLSQAKIGQLSGISQQYYNYIENGKRRPSVPVAKRIAAVLGFDWTLFYEDEQQEG